MHHKCSECIDSLKIFIDLNSQYGSELFGSHLARDSLEDIVHKRVQNRESPHDARTDAGLRNGWKCGIFFENPKNGLPTLPETDADTISAEIRVAERRRMRTKKMRTILHRMI